ncbi:Glycoside Hydrolase Family 6 protein, partial [Tuber magnatum]
LLVYDHPGSDSPALSSKAEFAITIGGPVRYKTRNMRCPDVNAVLTIEPDSFPNLVINSQVAKCSNIASTKKETTKCALEQLNIPKVARHMDAGDGG